MCIMFFVVVIVLNHSNANLNSDMNVFSFFTKDVSCEFSSHVD